MRTSPTRAVATVLVAAAFMGTACTSRSSQGDHQRTLFGPSGGQKPDGVEGDSVTLDAAAIDGDADRLELDLPDGRVTARRDHLVRRGARDFTWFGRTPGREGSNVTVTVNGDDVSAAVDTDSGTVAAHTSGKGVGLRTRLNSDRLREETDPEVVPEAGAAVDEGDVSIQATGDTVIDVLIVYNSAILRRYGSASTVKTVAQRMIDKANKSFTDSLIRLQYRLVNVAQVPDSEIAARVSWNGNDHLYNLRSTANSTSYRVGQLRNQYGADLVQAWGTFSGVCGVGYQPTISQSYGAAYGISAINNNRDCLEGVAVSHELGHNIGGGHDRVTSRRSSGGGDAYGMVDPSHRFLTIMGYETSCGPTYTYCTQTWTFSNPAVKFKGYPTGTAGSVDNARNINIIGPRVAAFKATRV